MSAIYLNNGEEKKKQHVYLYFVWILRPIHFYGTWNRIAYTPCVIDMFELKYVYMWLTM